MGRIIRFVERKKECVCVCVCVCERESEDTKMRYHNQFTANNQVFVNIALLALAIVCYIIADTKVPKLIRETPV